jgi:Uma2 family endonuclease
MSTSARAAEPEIRMSRQEYRTWLQQQPAGRFERIGGVVVAKAPERIAHVRIKARVWQSLDRAIRAAGVACEALMDGVTVEVGDSDYEPDAVVQCGPLDPNGVTADRPVIIVEVLSPSTRTIDRALKLPEYFRLPSLHHYLIVWADNQQVVHHQRGAGDVIETQVFTSGAMRLDPPGITIDLAELYTS